MTWEDVPELVNHQLSTITMKGRKVVYGFIGEGVLFPPLAIVSLAQQEGSCDRIMPIVS